MCGGNCFDEFSVGERVMDSEPVLWLNRTDFVLDQVVELFRRERHAIYQPLVDQGIEAATNFQAVIRFSDV
ncbi:hypothetical protein D3C77_787800 [compost metagenome]